MIKKLEGYNTEHTIQEKLNELIDAHNNHIHDVHGSQYYASKPKIINNDPPEDSRLDSDTINRKIV